MSPTEPEGAEREMEDLLRRVGPERPDPLRREAARRVFLEGRPIAAAGPSRAGSSERMGPVMASQGLGYGSPDVPEELDAFAAWLAAHPLAEAPSADVRRRSRLAFLTAIAGDAPRPRRSSRPVQGLVLALAAAAILAVTLLLPEPERWSVRLGGPLRFARGQYAPGGEARLAADLEGSGTVETAEGAARFSLSDELELELRPASALSFPVLPELDGHSALEFELGAGEAYLQTASTYPGNPIVVHTELADVALHGTTVGVLVDELGTCVCVCDGTVRVTSSRLSGGHQDLGPRRTLRLFHDAGMAPKLEPFPAEGSGPEAAHTGDLLRFASER
jgi:ferric-dicitrate binding protein FerR (iron transport regulator)